MNKVYDTPDNSYSIDELDDSEFIICCIVKDILFFKINIFNKGSLVGYNFYNPFNDVYLYQVDKPKKTIRDLLISDKIILDNVYLFEDEQDFKDWYSQ